MLADAAAMAVAIELHRRMGEKRLAAALTEPGSLSAGELIARAAEQLHVTARPADLRMAEKLRSLDGFLLIRGVAPYPQRMADVLGEDAPTLLYCRGNLDLLSSPMVAVIGTRRPTMLGRNIAREYVRELAKRGITIVSGNAPGVDSAAHEEALLAGGNTVFFPAVPLDAWAPEFHIPPTANGRYFIASPFVPGSETHPYCFLRRNALVAAMCQSALVAETGTRGGTLDTVGRLKELGRPTYAIDFDADARRHDAHRMLIGGGARPLPHQVSREAVELLINPPETSTNPPPPERDLFDPQDGGES